MPHVNPITILITAILFFLQGAATQQAGTYLQAVVSEWSPADFVVVFATHLPRLPLVHGSRAWRHGIRAFIFVDDTSQLAAVQQEGAAHHEVYLAWPDDPPGAGRGPKPSDTRAALAPFLTYKYMQEQGMSFTWMLYGDDDTLWIMHGVLKLLHGWDPSIPAAISDDYWPGHPNTDFFRCIPCHAPLTKHLPASMPTDKPAFKPIPGCPCGLHLMADSGSKGMASPNGGAGIILSSAFFNNLTVDAGTSCVLRQQPKHFSGSDALFAHCALTEGPGFTDPGYTILTNNSRVAVFGQNPKKRYWTHFLAKLDTAVQKSSCDDTCKFVVRNMVSIHLRPGKFRYNMTACGLAMHDLTSKHALALQHLGEPHHVLHHQRHPI